MPDNAIYDFLKENNLTTKDESSFLTEYSDKGKAQELYGFFKENNLTEKDFDSFYNEYLKKKDGGELPSGEQAQPSGSNGFRTVYQKGQETVTENKIYNKDGSIKEGNIEPSFDKEIPVFVWDEKKIEEEQVQKQKERKEKIQRYGEIVSESKNIISEHILKEQELLDIATSEYDKLYMEAYPIQQETGSLPDEYNKLIPDAMSKMGEHKNNLVNLGHAQDIVAKTEKYLKTRDSGVLESMFKNPLAKDFFSFGLNEIYRYENMVSIAKASEERELTQDEYLALFAYGLNQQIQGDEDVERTLSSMVGTGIADMIPYMIQFALTSGTVSSITTPTKAALKALLSKQIGNVTAKYVSVALSEILGAGVRSTMMFEFYKQIPERMIGNVWFEEKDGKLNIKITDQEEFLPALGKSYLNTMVEVGVEGLGQYVPKVLGGLGKRFPGNIMSNQMTPSTIRALSDAAGFHGIITEFGEEVATAYLQAPIEGQALKDVWDNKQMLATFLTVAAVGGTMHGANAALNGLTKNRGDAITSLRQYEKIIDNKTQVEVDEILSNENVDQVSSKIDSYLKKLTAEGATNEDIMNILGYISSKIRVNEINNTESIIEEERINESTEQETVPEKTVVEDIVEEVKEEQIPETETQQEVKVEPTETEQHKTEEEIKGKVDVYNVVVNEPSRIEDLGYDLYHASNIEDLNIESVSVEPRATRQGKKGDFGGFYGYNNLGQIGKFMFGNKAKNLYGIRLNPDVVIHEYEGDIERLDNDKLNELRDQGIQVISGKSILGKQEIVIVDKSAIQSISNVAEDLTITNKVKTTQKTKANEKERLQTQENVQEEQVKDEKVQVSEKPANLPKNVIETQEGLFELNEEQQAQREDMAERYGQERADELIKDFIDVNDLKKYSYTLEEKRILDKETNAQKQQGRNVRPKSEEVGQVEGIRDKDMPEVDRPELQDRKKVEEKVDSELKKIKKEKLDARENEAKQRLVDSLARLGGAKFAIQEGRSNDVWNDIKEAITAASEIGIIKIEKGVDHIISKLSGMLPGKGIEKYRDDINDFISREEKSKQKERKLGKKALESANLPQEFKDDIASRGIAYAVEGRKVEDAQAREIVNAYSESGNINELKEVIMNPANNIPGNVRTTLAVNYVKEALDRSKTETGATKEKTIRDAADVFNSDMNMSTAQAQALESKKRWSDVIGQHPDLIVESARRKNRKENEKRLEGSKEDMDTAQSIIEEYLDSKEFNDLLEKKIRESRESISDKSNKAKDKIKRGRDKLSDAANRMASLRGIRRNAVDENKIGDNEFKILVDAADGFLDIGVGSIETLISKLKTFFRDFLTPSEIDKHREEIIRETKAKTRLKRKPAKRLVLTEQELNKVVNNLFAKMIRPISKDRLRELARDYIDRVVEAGEMDKPYFQDLFAKALDLETLTPEMENDLRESAEQLNDARIAGENLKSLWKKYKLKKDEGKGTSEIETLVKEQIKVYNEAIKKALKANISISEAFAQDKSFGDLFSTFMQGNLLTARSLLTNIYANTFILPARALVFSVATTMDMMLYGVGSVKESLMKNIDPSKNPGIYRMFNKLPDKKRVYSMWGATKGFIPGMGKGFVDSLGQMFTGLSPEDAYIREHVRALHPIKAAVENIMMLKGKEKMKFDKFVKNLFESTLGIPPEIMFRLLNIGDKLFKGGATEGRLSEIAEIKGLEGVDRDVFMNMPDEESAEDARKVGLRFVYQQDNYISKALNSLVNDTLRKKMMENGNIFSKALYNFIKVVYTTQLPFTKTPTNVGTETFLLGIPPLSFALGMYFASKGDRRASIDMFSRAIVGASINTAFGFLLLSGIMTLGSAGHEEEEEGKQKVKESELRNKPPLYFNTDAWSRMLAGEDYSWREGDNLREVKRFGTLSSMAIAKAEALRAFESSGVDYSKMENMMLLGVNGIVPLAKSSLEQSFLAGVNSGLNAIMGGSYDQSRWVLNTTRSFSSIAIPNTFVQIQQYRDGYYRNIKEPTLSGIEKNKKEIKNTFKSMLLADNGLPAKVTVWGEDVKRVPDGKGLGYMLFDVTRSREYGSDFGVHLHELYENTLNRDVLPSVIGSSMYFEGRSVKLTPKLEYELKKDVGRARKMVVEPFVNTSWQDLPDNMKLFSLQKVYTDIMNPLETEVRTAFRFKHYSELKALDELQNGPKEAYEK